MNKYFTEREQAELIIDLVKSLNKGNSCDYNERVQIAERQFQQLECAIARLQSKKEAGF
jgi:hypothetical protein